MRQGKAVSPKMESLETELLLITAKSRGSFKEEGEPDRHHRGGDRTGV